MMLAKSSAIYAWPKMLLLVLLVGTFGCSGRATYIQAMVTDNPLDRVAQQAQEDWSVERVDANTLHLSQVWPFCSVWILGYCSSHAKLFYAASYSVLHIQSYHQKRSLIALFIPVHFDDEPDFGVGGIGQLFVWVPQLILSYQIDDILKWSGASVITRRTGDWSEPFPSGGVSASPPQ
ncbi:MAG: hypothetical protein HP497_04965 [Nitrospira sp.]|nr:hypothetical protein [Nitrospira sp.]